MADLNLAAAGALSTSQLFDDENGLRLMLNTIGVNLRERNKLIADGFTSMKTIIELHANDVAGFKSYLLNLNKTFASSSTVALRVYFTPINVSRLVGVVHYFNHAVNSFHKIPDILMIDTDDAADYAAHFRTSSAEPDDDVDVDIPLLTGSSNWIDFRDKFQMKLNQTMGTRGIHLDYILDNTVRGAVRANAAMIAVNSIDINDDDIFRTATTHFGRGYQIDNKTVWDMLKSLLLGHPPYNHINSYSATSNGRMAWNSLRTFYEGVDFQERTRESAFAKLTQTFYKGETARFNFEKYVATHKQAHKMLEDCNYNDGGGMDDATKVQHFKTGIKADAALENALSNARANPAYRTFDNLVSYLSAEVDHKSVRRQQLQSTKDRRVAGLDHNSNNSKGGRGKGKEKGRQNGNKKSGRDIESRFVDGKTVYAKQYQAKEFSALSRDQREAVISMNRSRRRASNNSTSDTHQISASTIANLRDDMMSMGEAIVAGVERATGEDISVVTTGTSPPTSSNDSPSKRRTADAGSIGDFFRTKRSRKSGN